VSVDLDIATVGAIPVLNKNQEDYCYSPHGSEIIWDGVTPKGTHYNATLCFRASEFEGRMLVPYRRSGNSVYANEELSGPVIKYQQEVAHDFVPSEEVTTWIDNQRWPVLKKHWTGAITWGAGGWFALAVVSFIIGWVVRGFLGIPDGKDFKPAPASPRRDRNEDDADPDDDDDVK
jgi:hypothetical protein